MIEGIFAYVPHSHQKQFEAIGWEYECDLGYPHACYASLYKWVGEGEPVYPETNIAIRKPVNKAQEDDS
jgi:hypothetical protein